MSAPIVDINSLINSINDNENFAKNTFQQCYEMIPDILTYSSDTKGDLTSLNVCMKSLAKSTNEMAALAHATIEINSLTEKSNLTKTKTVKEFENILNESLKEYADENQQQIMSSLNSFIQEEQDHEEDSEDNDVLVTKATRTYKDPLTQCRMKDPVKSKICNHSFERSSILKYLSGSNKRCPYSGCQSKLKKEDLMDHFVLKMQLLNAQQDEAN